ANEVLGLVAGMDLRRETSRALCRRAVPIPPITRATERKLLYPRSHRLRTAQLAVFERKKLRAAPTRKNSWKSASRLPRHGRSRQSCRLRLGLCQLRQGLGDTTGHKQRIAGTCVTMGRGLWIARLLSGRSLLTDPGDWGFVEVSLRF